MDSYMKKRIVLFSAWIILTGYILVHHFSLLNTAVFVVGALLGLWLAVLGQETREKGAADVAPHLLGLGFLELLGYEIMTVLVPMFQNRPTAIVPTFFGNLQNMAENLMHAGTIRIVIYFVILFVLYLLRSKAQVGFYANWLLTSMIFGVLLYGITGNLNAPAVLAAILYAVHMCDQMSVKYKQVRRWKTWLCILLIITALANPAAVMKFSQKGYSEYLFFEKIFTRWPMLLLFALSTVCLISFQFIHTKGRSVWFPDKDVKLMLLAVCSVPFVMVLHQFYTPAWPVFAILFSIASLRLIGLENQADSVAISRYYAIGYMPVVSVVLMAVSIAIHYGRGVGAVCFFAGLLIILHSLFDLRGMKARANEGHTIWGTSKASPQWQREAFWYSFTLVWGAVVAGCYVWYSCRAAYNFVLLAVILVLSILFVTLLCYEPVVFLQKRRNISPVVTALFVIACLLLVNSYGTKITVSTDCNHISVETEARGDQNRVVASTETWLEFDWIDSLRHGEKVNLELQERTNIPLSTGRFSVVTEDYYGVGSTATRWLHMCEYTE